MYTHINIYLYDMNVKGRVFEGSRESGEGKKRMVG
jgi:hypothetical protein